MLALANALVISPRLLLLDEPSLGLSQPLVSQALQALRQISNDINVTLIVVEQKVREVLRIAERVFVLRTGRISLAANVAELNDEMLRSGYIVLLRRSFLHNLLARVPYAPLRTKHSH